MAYSFKVLVLGSIVGIVALSSIRTQAQKLLLQLEEHRLPFVTGQNLTVEARDFDLDGDLDLFFGTNSTQLLQLLVNDGHGHFVDDTQMRFSQVLGPTQRFAFLDLDGDSFEDILSGEQTMLRVYLGNAQHTFRWDASRTIPVTLADSYAFLDIDGDLDIDVLVGTSFTQSLALFVNTGRGFFRDESASRLPLIQKRVAWIASADMDGDKDADFVLATTTDTSLYLNDGSGKFVEASDRLPTPRSAAPHALLTDIDANGTIDVLLSGKLRLWLNDGRANFIDRNDLLPSTPISATTTAVADFTEDGQTDIYVGRETTDMLLVSNGTRFVDASVLLSSLDTRTNAVLPVDVDGDGDLDVVSCHWIYKELLTNHNRHISITTSRIGRPVDLEFFANPGYATWFRATLPLVGLDAAQPPSKVPPFGLLMVNLNLVAILEPLLIGPAFSSGKISLSIPNDSLLVGRSLTAQGITFHSLSSPQTVRLTGLKEAKIGM